MARSVLSGSLVILLVALTRSLPAMQAPAKKSFTYDQVFVTPPQVGAAAAESTVLGRLPRVTGWLDDSNYLESRPDSSGGNTRIFAVNAADGREHLYRDYAEFQKNLPVGFTLDKAAAVTQDLSRFILNHDNDLYYYNIATRILKRITVNPAEERNPTFSPRGDWVAYTREGNLFAYDLENQVEHQYTTDGGPTVYNGWASWVYYEEILGRSSQYRAFWWSPDGTRLAFMRFDDSPVPAFPIYHADGQHGELEIERYPKAGDPNPYVAMAVVPVSGGKVVWMDFQPKADHYLAWPFWSADSKTLTVQWMNRSQNTIRLYNCNPSTGEMSPIFEEKQPSWVRFFEDVYRFKNGSGFLLRSDVDGWDHLYYYNNDGTLKKRLTVGNWRVDRIASVDEAGGYVYFTARPGKPWDTQLMRVKLDGTGQEQLTRGEGTHHVRISPGAGYFIDSVSTVSAPAAMNLFRGNGTLLRKVGDERTTAMEQYAWGKAELFTVPSGDGYDLPAYWVLPVEFSPDKRYPVIFDIYGGPDAGTVHNSWLGLSPHYWAQRGVITISVDHRGAGAFGKKRVALMRGNLGKWEMTDLIAAVKWLRAKPFVAADKIGITGSSYGGYTTLMALTYAADYFNYGQAGSPVTDWRLYDSVYAERYMGTPAENPEGYKNSSVLTWIDRYKGNLRITHGTTDDNVHMQNSIQVIDWLTTHARHFELMLYPDSRHNIRSAQRPHLMRETHDFWVRNLLDGRIPVSIEGYGH